MDNTKVSFRKKNPTICPVCKTENYKEELLTGGGRMNAGELTDELHRKYNPTKKFGAVYPLLYPITVCPRCWFASFPRHFEALSPDIVEELDRGLSARKNLIRPLFEDVDFSRNRTLKDGISSYVLAAACYDSFPKSISPSILQGLCFLRAAWLSDELHELEPDAKYDYLTRIFYRKAVFSYGEALRNQDNKSENWEEIPHLGPDLDNNYGYDGVYYLVGVLQLKYGDQTDSDKRANCLNLARTAVSRIVGIGETSKAKPSAFLDLGRELHKSIKEELKHL